jgi:hypothetical protein
MTRLILHLLLVAGFVIPVVAMGDEPKLAHDAKLTRSSGDAVTLKSFFGKPVILVYESPDSAKVNEAAKLELKRLSDLYHLRNVVDVVAVVNLEGIDWWPARPIVLGVVRGEEKKHQLPVLVDMHGALRKAPWNLNPKTSTMMVISPEGELLYREAGKVQGQRMEDLKSTLKGLLTTVSAR